MTREHQNNGCRNQTDVEIEMGKFVEGNVEHDPILLMPKDLNVDEVVVSCHEVENATMKQVMQKNNNSSCTEDDSGCGEAVTPSRQSHTGDFLDVDREIISTKNTI